MSSAATGRMKLEISVRRRRVAELRRRGATLAYIAEEVDASTATVHRDVQAIVFDLRERSVDEIEQWRSVKLERYRAKMELIDAAIDALASSDKLAPLVTAWVRIDIAESRLLGTDAPERATVSHYVQPMSELRAREILDEMNELETE